MSKPWIERNRSLSLKQQWENLYNIKVKQNNKGLWGAGEGILNAQAIIDFLPGLFKELDVKTFIDCGCGNFFWMNKVGFGEVKYTGVDIVNDLIESNKIKYPGVDFRCMNIVDEVVPKNDLVFARSVFIHLTIKDILKSIKNLKKSGSTYLMTSTSPQVKCNKDTECILLVKRNMTLEPFNWPEPIILLNERPDIKDPKILPKVSYMGIWEIEKL